MYKRQEVNHTREELRFKYPYDNSYGITLNILSTHCIIVTLRLGLILSQNTWITKLIQIGGNLFSSPKPIISHYPII